MLFFKCFKCSFIFFPLFCSQAELFYTFYTKDNVGCKPVMNSWYHLRSRNPKERGMKIDRIEQIRKSSGKHCSHQSRIWIMFESMLHALWSTQVVQDWNGDKSIPKRGQRSPNLDYSFQTIIHTRFSFMFFNPNQKN